MYCRKCGNEMPDDSIVCNKCGQPVNEVKKKYKEPSWMPIFDIFIGGVIMFMVWYTAYEGDKEINIISVFFFAFGLVEVLVGLVKLIKRTQ